MRAAQMQPDAEETGDDFCRHQCGDMAEMQHQRSDQRIGLDRRAERHDPHVCEHAIKDLREEECDQHAVAE